MYNEESIDDEVISKQVKILGRLRIVLRSIRRDVRCQTYAENVTEPIIQSHVNGFLYGQVGDNRLKYTALKDLQVRADVTSKKAGELEYKIMCKSEIVKSFVDINKFILYAMIHSEWLKPNVHPKLSKSDKDADNE